MVFLDFLKLLVIGSRSQDFIMFIDGIKQATQPNISQLQILGNLYCYTKNI